MSQMPIPVTDCAICQLSTMGASVVSFGMRVHACVMRWINPYPSSGATSIALCQGRDLVILPYAGYAHTIYITSELLTPPITVMLKENCINPTYRSIRNLTYYRPADKALKTNIALQPNLLGIGAKFIGIVISISGKD